MVGVGENRSGSSPPPVFKSSPECRFLRGTRKLMVVAYHTSGKYDLCSSSFVFLLDESECECGGGAQGGAEGEGEERQNLKKTPC